MSYGFQTKNDDGDVMVDSNYPPNYVIANDTLSYDEYVTTNSFNKYYYNIGPGNALSFSSFAIDDTVASNFKTAYSLGAWNSSATYDRLDVVELDATSISNLGPTSSGYLLPDAYAAGVTILFVSMVPNQTNNILNANGDYNANGNWKLLHGWASGLPNSQNASGGNNPYAFSAWLRDVQLGRADIDYIYGSRPNYKMWVKLPNVGDAAGFASTFSLSANDIGTRNGLFSTRSTLDVKFTTTGSEEPISPAPAWGMALYDNNSNLVYTGNENLLLLKSINYNMEHTASAITVDSEDDWVHLCPYQRSFGIDVSSYDYQGVSPTYDYDFAMTLVRRASATTYDVQTYGFTGNTYNNPDPVYYAYETRGELCQSFMVGS